MKDKTGKNISRKNFIRKALKIIIISLAIYLCCLTAGVACVYLVHKKSNRSLEDNALRAAGTLSAGEDLGDTYSSMRCKLYLYKDGEIEALQTGTIQDYESYIYRYSSYADDGESHYRLIMDISEGLYAAMACAPVSDGSTLFIFQSVRTLNSSLKIFAILCSVLYVIVTACILMLQRKNEKINEIYRCYVANVSHELKSPIASILALTESLSEDVVKDEAEKSRYYGMIYREARSLEKSVKDIMELSKIQEKRTDFSCSEVTPSKLFGPTCMKYKELCADMDITFEADSSLYALPSLHTNKDRISQLMEILLNNAIKFMDDGKDGKITISATQQANHAVICVHDNGIGIEPDDLPHVFERFFKSNLSHNSSGTGLGLAIAKEIAQALNEKIYVESVPGEGTSFYFTIRCRRMPSSAPSSGGKVQYRPTGI